MIQVSIESLEGFPLLPSTEEREKGKAKLIS